MTADYAVVDTFGDYRLAWTPDPTPIVRYLYRHPDAKLLICHKSPADHPDCRRVAMIEPQLTLETIGLTMAPADAAGSRLIATLDALLGGPLDQGQSHYGAAHAKRLAYLTLYLAALKHLRPNDTRLLLLAAYLHDFGHDHAGFTGRDGLARFRRYLGGSAARLHATLAAIMASSGQPWSQADTNRLICVLETGPVTGWARRLQGWATELRELDALRFGRPVNLGRLHDRDILRLLYASHQELNLIPDRPSKEEAQ